MLLFDILWTFDQILCTPLLSGLMPYLARSTKRKLTLRYLPKYAMRYREIRVPGEVKNTLPWLKAVLLEAYHSTNYEPNHA
jgi:hypothetical protein